METGDATSSPNDSLNTVVAAGSASVSMTDNSVSILELSAVSCSGNLADPNVRSDVVASVNSVTVTSASGLVLDDTIIYAVNDGVH
jgi:hypothetical protein